MLILIQLKCKIEPKKKERKSSNQNCSLCPAGDKCVDCQCKSPLPPGCDCDPGNFYLIWFFSWFKLYFSLIWFLIWLHLVFSLMMLIPPGCDCDPGHLIFRFDFIGWDVYMILNVISPLALMICSSWLWLWSGWFLLLCRHIVKVAIWQCWSLTLPIMSIMMIITNDPHRGRWPELLLCGRPPLRRLQVIILLLMMLMMLMMMMMMFNHKRVFIENLISK